MNIIIKKLRFMTSNTFVKNVEHESAIKHVTGRAIYTDDISEPRNLLHAAIGFSPVSKGIIEKIDFSEVLKSDGVVDIITEKDIEGQNDVGPIFKGDKIDRISWATNICCYSIFNKISETSIIKSKT